ncbi:MAG: hypothetical protein COA79_08325 [Planctomycetota bacterium]|nr:MAG: hypothetical protein COA79_08325 [Planctomycetota bacterium]
MVTKKSITVLLAALLLTTSLMSNELIGKKYTLAQEYVNQKYFADALLTYQEIIGHDTKESGKAYFKIGDMYIVKGEPRKALVNYMRVYHVYDDTLKLEALSKMGDIYSNNLKDFKRAAECYSQVLKMDPQNKNAPDNLYKLGNLHYNKLKDKKKALECYLAVQSKYPKTQPAHDSLVAAADIYLLTNKDFKEAIKKYRIIDNDFPKSSVSALYLAGVIYEKNLKDKEEAIKAYEAFYKKYPKSKDASKALARLSKLRK